MKRMLIMALLLTLCMGTLAKAEPAAPASPVPGNRLGLECLRALYNGKDNQFVSPVSLAYALSMAAAGAEGETKAELLAALDATDALDIAALGDTLNGAGLRLANAAFVQPGTTLLSGYQEALAGFGAEGFPLEDAARVNEWAREKTGGLIDPFLDELSDDTRLMLVNAAAMDAEWQLKFDAESTREDTFHAPGGDVRVDFMGQVYDYPRYGEVDGTQVIALDYRDSTLRMVLALPPENGMEEALDALAVRGRDALAFEPMDCRVYLRLPRLDVSAVNGLSGTLRALGVARAFEDDADFSALSDRPLKIDEVLQKVRVQVDEEGTRAAAVTAVLMVDGGEMVGEQRPMVSMLLDRPFILLIEDEQSGAIAFAGVVAAPEAPQIGEREMVEIG